MKREKADAVGLPRRASYHLSERWIRGSNFIIPPLDLDAAFAAAGAAGVPLQMHTVVLVADFADDGCPLAAAGRALFTLVHAVLLPSSVCFARWSSSASGRRARSGNRKSHRSARR